MNLNEINEIRMVGVGGGGVDRGGGSRCVRVFLCDRWGVAELTGPACCLAARLFFGNL